MSRALYICLLLLSLSALSQDRKPFLGKVVSGEMVIEDIFIINKATGAETKTNNKGIFTLPVKVGDQLVIYGTKTDVREFTINNLSFKEQPYVVSVEIKGYELEEVVVEGSTVTSESLGLVPKGQKQYTPAERKLYTATEGTDAIFNALSGRTKMLKKAAETEKKEGVIETLNGMYTDTEIVEQLNIPAEYVRAFLFYVAEDKSIAKALKGDNESLVRLLMIDLAKKYLTTLKDGK
jgi:hypothetical protein